MKNTKMLATVTSMSAKQAEQIRIRNYIIKGL